MGYFDTDYQQFRTYWRKMTHFGWRESCTPPIPGLARYLRQL